MTVCWNERRGLGEGGGHTMRGGGACDAATRHHICVSMLHVFEEFTGVCSRLVGASLSLT